MNRKVTHMQSMVLLWNLLSILKLFIDDIDRDVTYIDRPNKVTIVSLVLIEQSRLCQTTEVVGNMFIANKQYDSWQNPKVQDFWHPHLTQCN